MDQMRKDAITLVQFTVFLNPAQFDPPFFWQLVP